MKKCTVVSILVSTLFVFAVTAQSKVVTRAVPYEHNGAKLEGYLAYDDSVQGKRPGVLVVHEWWGLNEYARSRAEQLAAMGYVAFALDMYGAGKVTEHPSQASEWSKQVRENMDLWRSRALAGLKVLQNAPNVDQDRMAAIGYCFGGSTVQHLAYSGADIRGVVSFHGSLVPPAEGAAGVVKAKILICHGADDPLVKDDQLITYLGAMRQAGLDWQMVFYGGARHSFTNPDADNVGMAPLKYSPSADARSWSHMKLFFQEIFGMN
jgi:dienelactone hydrolase